MVAQLINFGIVVGVLWLFVFKPLGSKMTERTKTIEKSLAEAKTIAENLKQSESDKAAIVKDARTQAERLINEARQLAEQEREKSLSTAKAEVKKVIEAGKLQLNSEKEKMISAVRQEVAGLVVTATQKVLSQVVDKKIDQKLAEEVLKKVKK